MLQPYQERVIAERDGLSEKIDKLRTFVNSAASMRVSGTEGVLLMRQYTVMAAYLDILNERIAAFGV